MRSKLSIVILNYRNTNLLIQNLQTLLKHPPNSSFEILLVDNHSNDGSAQRLHEAFSAFRVIETSQNGGYSYGNNVAIREACGEYLLILNPDITVQEGEIQIMIDWMDRHPDVGISGPKLLNRDGSIQWSCTRFPTFWVPLFRRTMFGKTQYGRRILQRYLMLDWDHQYARTVDALFGAALFVRRSALPDVGLLDEHFFMYVEDIDWCRRFWKAGWKVAYCPNAAFLHDHKRGSSKRTLLQSLFSRLAMYHLKSWFYYFWKYRNELLPSTSPHLES
ncbi:MAG: glycosyltransferase family 2 protein [Candidatus Kerfeldbacteria bacterium]|nr:glycosyltransferase family 2 protein [Candidatus Kerfeldbacteria bacterium]